MLECERCSYETEFIGNLRKHFKRSIECEDINNCEKTCEYLLKNITQNKENYTSICEFCKKVYKTRQSKYLHKQTCKGKKELLENTPELKRQLEQIKNRDDSKIYAFGDEKIDYITEDIEFLNECVKKITSGAISDIIKRIYFNDEHPENKNIYLKNMRDKKVLVFKNKEWVCEPMTEIIPIMITTIYRILIDHFNNHKDQIEVPDGIDRDKIIGDKYDSISNLNNKKCFFYIESVTAIRTIIGNYRINGKVVYFIK